MAFQSMTGFGKGEAEDNDYTLSVEMKSVNHRFREMRFKMPSIFSSIELDLKKVLTAKFKRGSFDIYVNYKKNDSSSRFDDLDEDKIKSFIKKIQKCSGDSELAINPASFLSSEFYREKNDSDFDGMRSLLKKAFDIASTALESSRRDEGEKLRTVIKGHRNNYNELFAIIQGETPHFQEMVKAKLEKKFKEVAEHINIDENRYMQEVIYYLEKLDVAEELNRIESHIVKLDQLVESKSEVGRQIDFLLQELGRETNTIGSKSNSTNISETVVKMKVELEKIREQGLNIE